MQTLRHHNTHWFKTASIYHILIDRFAGYITTTNTPDFIGGTIKAITDKLDYISNLGFDTIWLSPFYEAESYHGYDITNYERVHPKFGTTADLKELIHKVHEKNMNIIADFVPNHCSKNHPFFVDALNNPKSKYRFWFHFTSWPQKYLCFLDYDHLPKFNLDNYAAREYMINIANYWLDLGLDGFRLDHVVGPTHEFWQDFKQSIKSRNPGIVLIGEAWGAGTRPEHYETLNIRNKWWRKHFGVSQESLQFEYSYVLDGVLDFELQNIIKSTIKNDPFLLKKSDLILRIKKHYDKYPDDFYLVSFLDNHDMNRFLFECIGNAESLMAAVNVLMELPYPMATYYGTEKLMQNKENIWSGQPYADIAVREPMDWSNASSHLCEYFTQQNQKRQDISNLINLKSINHKILYNE